MINKRLALSISMLVMAAIACSLPFGAEEEPTEAPATAEPEVIVVTATNLPEPTATYESVEENAGITATADRNLNVRSGPGTSYAVAGSFAEGQTAPVIGQNTGGTWILISLPGGGSGWVSTAYATIGDLSGIPVVNVPPPSSSGSGSGGSSPTSPPPTATNSGSGGGGQTAPSDSNISTELNIKNGVVNESGVISYPNGDTQDQVFIKVVGFDSITTSGYANFTLTCSGDGAGNVQVFGGGDCNETWEEFFTNDNDQETIRVYLESGSNAYVNWTLIVSANN